MIITGKIKRILFSILCTMLLFSSGCEKNKLEVSDSYVNILEYCSTPISATNFKDMYTTHIILNNSNTVTIYGSFNQPYFNSFLMDFVDIEIDYIYGAVIQIKEEDKQFVISKLNNSGILDVEQNENLSVTDSSSLKTDKIIVVFDDNGSEQQRIINNESIDSEFSNVEDSLKSIISDEDMQKATENIEHMLDVYLKDYI